MPSRESTNFAEAHRKLQKAAQQNPEWFDRARDVLKHTDDGSMLLLHALMDGMREAYEAGRAGKEPPPLRLVQSSAELRSLNSNAWREEPAGPDMHPAAVARRTSRRAVPVPDAQPAPARRRTRGVA